MRRVSLRFFDSRLLQNQIKNAIRLTNATPPITPPATAIVDPFPLLPLFPVDDDDDDTTAPFVACELAAAVDDASPMVVKADILLPGPRTSLWAAWDVVVAAIDAVVKGVVVKAAVVVSVTLACGGGTATAADKDEGSGVDVGIDADVEDEEAMMENWPIEAEVVVATGGGIVCSTVFWTAGAGATWAAVVVDIKDSEEVVKDVEKVLVVLV